MSRIRQIAALSATIALIGCSTGPGDKPMGDGSTKSVGTQSSRVLRKKPASTAPRSAATRTSTPTTR